MKTKREWLAEQGLAIAGARGKFSTDANAALAAEEARCSAENIPLPWVEIVKPEPKRKKRNNGSITAFEKSQGVTEESVTFERKQYDVIVSPPKQREETHAYVIDQYGFLVAIQFCGKCQKSISRCTHDVPYAPDYLGGGLASFTRPEM
jgi:hypothetical protein